MSKEPPADLQMTVKAHGADEDIAAAAASSNSDSPFFERSSD
jgi:hypothetical protein